MARATISICKLTTANSSVALIPTMAAITTVAANSPMINVKTEKADRLILIVEKTASGANTATKQIITILDGYQTGASHGYSAHAQNDLEIVISSAAKNYAVCGPFETARFKDSDGYIKINATRGSNIASIGAILI